MKQINLKTGEVHIYKKSGKLIRHSKDEALEQPEQEELIKAIDKLRVKDETKLKYRILIALTMEAGLRVSEAIQCRLSWINNTPQGITINIPQKDRDLRNMKRDWTPKTPASHREVIFLDDKIGSMVKTFMISNKKGLGFSRQRAGQVVKMLGGLINKPKLHPHALRSTYANNLVYAGVNVNTLQYYMGWVDLVTAMNYVRSSKLAARRDLLRKFNKEE